MLLEAFAFELYLRIALFIQIIVTNCMILGRAESFASRQPVGAAVLDALGTAVGFAIALLTLGAVREVLGYGTLLRDMDLLFGEPAVRWIVPHCDVWAITFSVISPGAFLLAGLLFALVQGVLTNAAKANEQSSESINERS